MWFVEAPLCSNTAGILPIITMVIPPVWPEYSGGQRPFYNLVSNMTRSIFVHLIAGYYANLLLDFLPRAGPAH